MNLRNRLLLLITTVFLLVSLVGAVTVVNRARSAVADEMKSSVRLSVELLTLIAPLTGSSLKELERLRAGIHGLSATRHLRIELMPAEGVQDPDSVQEAAAVYAVPAWFVRAVRPSVGDLHRIVQLASMPDTAIVVIADPSAEIAEVWADCQFGLMGLLLLFASANGMLILILNIWLQPLQAILHGLGTIEHGDYSIRLPRYRLPEFQAIADKFNHMVGVLQQSQAQNRLLTAHSLSIQEQERRHLARELHDEMGQAMVAIKALAVSIEQGSDDNGAKASARTISKVSAHIYDVVRNMIRTLRPCTIDELGLVAALQDMTDEWNIRHGDMFCELHIEGKLKSLPEAAGIGVYRVVQECLTNVAKHAQATHVRVSLIESNLQGSEILKLTISDDGIGMRETECGGLGMLGMRERIAVLGGTLELETNKGSGVRIIAKIPTRQATMMEAIH